MTQYAVELTISSQLFMLESKLTALEVRFEGLADKLELVLEDIFALLRELKEDIYEARNHHGRQTELDGEERRSGTPT